MAKQTFNDEQIININLMLAHIRCVSELIHTLPEHKFEFKAYFKELFDTVKKYEEALNKMTNYNEDSEGTKQQNNVYDNLMEVTYTIRNIILNIEEKENE